MNDQESAGDIIYNSLLCRAITNKEELLNKIGEICREFFVLEDHRFSNGAAIDLILLLLDYSVMRDDIPEFRELVEKYDKEVEASPRFSAAD